MWIIADVGIMKGNGRGLDGYWNASGEKTQVEATKQA
jgi:hypothetical protein